MGTVYLAQHPDIGRKVAVKVLRPEYWDNAESLERLFREAQSSAAMRHPALVDVIDFGVHASLHCAYVVMEYLEGESLEARLARVGRLPPVLAVDFARQIAMGAGFAHHKGIIHRDLKPANVFIVPDLTRPGAELIKILDFGIAKVTNPALAIRAQATRTDAIIGTPLYMAPEQCRGAGKVDLRTDIYALGCILYEMLCGRPPFAYTWPGELIAAHLSETPAAPRALNPAIPEALDAVVCKLLAKDPSARYQTMAELSDELEKLLATQASIPPAAGWTWNIAGSPPPPGAPFASQQSQPGVRTPHPSGSAAPLPGIGPGHTSMPPGAESPLAAGAGAISGGIGQPLSGSTRPPVGVTSSKPFQPSRDTTLSNGASEVLSSRTKSPSASPRSRIAAAAALGLAALAAVVGIAVALYPDRLSERYAGKAANAPAPSASQNVPEARGTGATAQAADNDNDNDNRPQEALAPPPIAIAADTTTEPLTPPPLTPPPLPSPPATPESAPITRPPRTDPPKPPRVEIDTIRVTVTNTRPGLAVAMDGRAMSLPLRLPRDQQQHTLTFSAPKCRPETVTIRADKDTALTLQYRPTLYVP